MIHPYRESISSQLYPGNQQSGPCLIPAVENWEKQLSLPKKHRHKIIWRADQGFGTDANINWLLKRGYGLLIKGKSNRRAATLGHKVKRWHPVRGDKFVGRIPTPSTFYCPVDTIAVCYPTPQGLKYTYLISTLKWSARETALHYDMRGGSETQFRSDKNGGLQLHKRRKHQRDAQEIWIILTDMAHNYLSWLTYTLFDKTPFEDFGFLRLSRELFHLPGIVEFENGHLVSVKLMKSSPYANDLLQCFRRFWS